MKIAVATTNRWNRISGHAGKAKHGLLFDAQTGKPVPEDDGSLSLCGVSTIVTARVISATPENGTQVLLTGATDPAEAVRKLLAWEPPTEARFDVTTSFLQGHRFVFRPLGIGTEDGVRFSLCRFVLR